MEENLISSVIAAEVPISVADLTSKLNDCTDALVAATTAARALQGVNPASLVQLSQSAEKASSALDDMNTNQQAYVQSGKQLQAVVTEQAVTISQQTTSLSAMRQELNTTTRALNDLRGAYGEALKNSSQLQQIEQELIAKQNQLSASISQTSTTMTKTTTAVGGLSNMIERMGLRFILYNTVFQTTIELISAVGDKIKQLNQLADPNGQARIDAAKQVSAIYIQEAVSIDNLKSRFEATTSSMDDKQEVVQELNDKFGTQIGKINGINDAEKFFTDKSQAFIQALNLRATAMGAFAAQVDYAKKEIDLLADPKSALDNFDKLGVAAQTVQETLLTPQRIIDFGDNYDYNSIVAGANQADKLLDNLRSKSKIAQDIYIKSQNDADKLDVKNNFDTDTKAKKLPKPKSPHDYTNNDISAAKFNIDADAKNQQLELQLTIDNNKAIADNDKKTLSERLLAYDKYYQARIEQINTEHDKEQQDALISLDAINKIKEKQKNGYKPTIQETNLIKKEPGYLDITKSADSKANDSIGKLVIDKQKEQVKIFKDNLNEQIAGIDTDVSEKLAAIQADVYNKTQAILNNNNLSSKQKTTQIKKVGNQGTQESDQAKIDGLESQKLDNDRALNEGILSETAYKDKVAAIEKQITDLKQQELDKQVAAAEAAQKKQEQGEQQILDASLSAVQSFTQSEATIRNNYYAQQLINLQSQEQAEQLQYTQRIQAIQAEAGFSIEKQNELEILNAQNQAQQNQQAAEARHLQQQQAIAQKEAGITAAIVNTAEGVTKALTLEPPYSYILAAITAASGAAQIAAAESAPIPQFWKGTSSSPEGFAWTGEKGTELKRTPGRNWELTPGNPTLEYLQAGTQIIPHEQTKDILKSANYNIIPKTKAYIEQSIKLDMAKLGQHFDATGDRIVYAINRQKPVILNGINANWNTYMVKSIK